MPKAKVAIIMGSQSDLETMNEAINFLKEAGVGLEAKVLSAHRTPKEVAKFVEGAPGRGIQVFIAAAGGAAALAGVVAAHTVLPVIGVPIETKSLGGLDSLLSTVQMPAGIPVASMAIGKAGARNAAILAMEILGVSDKKIHDRLVSHKKEMRKKVTSIKLKV